MVNIRTKGQNGEREAIALISEWALPVVKAADLPAPKLSRNLVQSRSGGYDVVGIDWLALEVKRHETLQVNPWWRQTLKQTGVTQLPLLMYRQNRTPWRFRTLITCAHYSPCGDSLTSKLTVDMVEDEARTWFQTELWVRVKKSVEQVEP